MLARLVGTAAKITQQRAWVQGRVENWGRWMTAICRNCVQSDISAEPELLKPCLVRDALK